MNSENDIRELRLKGSSTILGYLKRFSATEKVIFGVFAFAALVTALTMAGQANSLFMKEIPARGGILHEGLVGLPHYANPILAVTDIDKDISNLVYAGLTRHANGEPIPELAASWEVSPDGLVYTFDLKEDLSFQNGSPLTADDVVFTINKIKDPAFKSPRAPDWNGVTAEAVSPSRVRFTLRQPYSSFLANTSIGILPKSIWGSVTDEQFIFSEYNVRPIGAGPYEIVEVKRDQGGIPTEYTLEAWNDYKGERPHISSIVLSFFPDLDHAIDALTTGGIQSLSSLPPAVAHELSLNKGEPYAIASAPLTRVFGVFFNQNKNSLLADASIRRALDMSIDRKAIVDSVLLGYGTAVSSPFPSGSGLGSSTAAAPADTAAAQALLAKGGWKMSPSGILEKKPTRTSATTTLSLTLFTADTADLRQAADLIRSQWQKMGAQVTVKAFPPTELYQNTIRTREYDALLFGQVVGKSSDYYAFWHSSQRNAPGLNVSMYANSRADRLLESIRSATSSDARGAAYASLANELHADVPAVFIYSPDLVYAVPKSLKGFRMGLSSSATDRFQYLSEWYLETDRVWTFFENFR